MGRHPTGVSRQIPPMRWRRALGGRHPAGTRDEPRFASGGITVFTRGRHRHARPNDASISASLCAVELTRKLQVSTLSTIFKWDGHSDSHALSRQIVKYNRSIFAIDGRLTAVSLSGGGLVRATVAR